MKINKQELEKIARLLSSILEKEGIHSVNDLEGKIGGTYFVEENAGDYIEIILLPSKSSTVAYTINYIRPKRGVPIEVKINKSLNYSTIMLKCEEKIEGYEPFWLDPFRNMMQSKDIRSTDFQDVLNELKKLGGVYK